MQASRIVRRHPHAAPTDLCSAFCSLYITARGLNTSAVHRAAGGSNNATSNPMHSAPPGTTKRDDKATAQLRRADQVQPPGPAASSGVRLTAAERIRDAEAAKKARDEFEEQKKAMQSRQMQGGLAKQSIFADPAEEKKAKSADVDAEDIRYVREDKPLSERNHETMEFRLNPRPNARARWMRKMVIKEVHQRGRISRKVHLARTERIHTVKSPFFKTSVKKLAPLARQIAGKSIDEAIMQMRFSKKKASKYILTHLIHARNEAAVVRGMGIPEQVADAPVKDAKQPQPRYDVASIIKAAVGQAEEPVLQEELELPTEKPNIYIENPSNTPPLPTQRPDKSLVKGVAAKPTDIYIAQAWVNRGIYLRVPSPRARGRMDILRPPHTGISVMLKEEKTRTREKAEKEMKAIRKRLNGGLWTQLPDRPITRQHQQVLW